MGRSRPSGNKSAAEADKAGGVGFYRSKREMARDAYAHRMSCSTRSEIPGLGQPTPVGTESRPNYRNA